MRSDKHKKPTAKETVLNLLPENKKLLIPLIITTILSVVFTALVFIVGVLPTIANVAIALLLLLIVILIGSLLRSRKEKTRRRKAGVVLAVILSLILSVGVYYLYSTYSVFNSISGSDGQTEAFHLVALKEGSYNELKDADGKVALVTDVQNDTYKEAKTLLRNEIDIIYNAAGDYLHIGHKLVDEQGKTHDELLFISNAYYDILCDEIDGFKKQTKIIHTVTVDIESVDRTKRVDVTKEAFNVYISGIDTYGNIQNVSRSDVNMLMTVNPVTKKILLTSIPRDMYVTLHSYGQKDKLTHSGIYGINETVATAEDWLGIDINYYARVNFTTLVDIVDVLGGIDVESVRAFSSSVSDYSYTAGTNHLSGEAALYFARERKSLPGGDNDRVQNQQRVLKAIINKVTTSPVILTKYTQLLKAMEGKVQTSLSDNDIAALVQAQLDDLGGWEIKTISIKGKGQTATTYSMGDRKVYVAVPDEESVQTAQRAIDDVLSE